MNQTNTDPRHRSRHNTRRRATRRLLLGGAGAAVCAALTIGPAVQANAAPGTDRRPSREAAAVGITAAGGGYAGWSAQRQQTRNQNGSSSSTGAGSASPGVTVTPKASSSTVAGIDVASYQGNVNWSSWWSKGKRFAYTKATEGTSYTNPYFSQQYTGSNKVGMIRGAYHFARPDGKNATDQAAYFVKHGGGWSADGKTLPGALDIEDNYTGGDRCWGRGKSGNALFIKNFSNKYHALTGRWPVIYTNISFWKACVASSAFSGNSPLWIAYWSSSQPTSLIGGWNYWTFWQYSGSGTDLDKFSASMTRLKALATG